VTEHISIFSIQKDIYCQQLPTQHYVLIDFKKYHQQITRTKRTLLLFRIMLIDFISLLNIL